MEGFTYTEKMHTLKTLIGFEEKQRLNIINWRAQTGTGQLETRNIMEASKLKIESYNLLLNKLTVPRSDEPNAKKE